MLKTLKIPSAEEIDRKKGHINSHILTPLIKAMEIIEPVSEVKDGDSR